MYKHTVAKVFAAINNVVGQAVCGGVAAGLAAAGALSAGEKFSAEDCIDGALSTMAIVGVALLFAGFLFKKEGFGAIMVVIFGWAALGLGVAVSLNPHQLDIAGRVFSVALAGIWLTVVLGAIGLVSICSIRERRRERRGTICP